MSRIGYEEALAENEALKDTIAVVLAQKNDYRRTNEKLKQEIASLKQDLEVAKDNELHLETIEELREENRRLKEMKFRQYVAVDIDGNIVDYAIMDGDRVYPLKKYIEIVKKEAVKGFAKDVSESIDECCSLYGGIKSYDYETMQNMRSRVNELAKEYCEKDE